MILLLAFALAEPPLEAPLDVQPTVEEEPLDAVPADELLRRAGSAIGRRGFEGARVLARTVLDNRESGHEHAAYLHALSFELENRHAEALTGFDTVLQRWPDGAFRVHTLFRRAEVKALLGDPDGALADLDLLGPVEAYDADDQAKIALWRATWTIERGDWTAIAMVEAALASSPEHLTFYRARAMVAAGYAHIAHAEAEWPLDSPKKRKANKALKRRMWAMQHAEDAVQQAVRQREATWILEGLLVLGRAWEQLGDDVANAPVPRRSKRPDAYRAELHREAAGLWTRAYAYYDEGEKLGIGKNIDNPRVAALGDARDAVQDKIDAAPLPGG